MFKVTKNKLQRVSIIRKGLTKNQNKSSSNVQPKKVEEVANDVNFDIP